MTTKPQKIEGGWESRCKENKQGWEKEAKDSVEKVVRATMDFIKGKLTVEQREAVYDKHMDFISDLLASERQRCVEETDSKIKQLKLLLPDMALCTGYHADGTPRVDNELIIKGDLVEFLDEWRDQSKHDLEQMK